MGRTSDARERLIDTAVGLIRARSYASVSVDDLCRGAGVRKGSFYHFFPSKRDLALAALDAWWETTRSEVLEPAFQPDVPPLQRIQRAFQRAAGQQSRNKERAGNVQGCPFGNLALELSSQDEVIRQRLQGAFGRFAGYFERALAEASTAGQLPPGTDVPAAAQALLAYLYGMILLAKTADDVGVMERLGPLALRLVTAPDA
ncbi:MAG TPA: TetR/AcrR family transcriptional regulator [bacterium]|nr:TetR/AcrR family transcriptional regulator [bacterium]